VLVDAPSIVGPSRRVSIAPQYLATTLDTIGEGYEEKEPSEVDPEPPGLHDKLKHAVCFCKKVIEMDY
jgi:hypothetical protein